MSEKQHRRWFQFHLLTLVLLSLIAAAMLWKNAVPRHSAWYMPKLADHGGSERLQQEMMQDKFWIRGWPLVYSMQYVDAARGPMDEPNHAIIWVMNTVIAAAMLLVVALICEFLIRRREAR